MGYSLIHLAIMAIVIAGIIAVTLIIIKRIGWVPPDWVVNIFYVISSWSSWGCLL
jgi:hypothetical protein